MSRFRGATVALLVVGALASGDRVTAQQPPDSAAAVRAETSGLATPGEPVVVGGDTLFHVYGRLGPFSPFDRARAAERRMHELIRNPVPVTAIGASPEGSGYNINAGDIVVVRVMPEDAAALDRPIDAVATEYAQRIRLALAREIEAHSVTSILMGVVYTILATALLILVLRLLSRLFRAGHARLDAIVAERVQAVRIQQFEVVSAARVARGLGLLLRATRVVVTLLLLYLYLPLVLSFFPWTRGLSGEIVGWVTRPVALVVLGVLGYLPSLFTIGVIVLATYYAIKLVKQFFLALASGQIGLRGFYPEWAIPTYKIVRFLMIALGLIMVWPYLPNSDSDAFRGVAAFLGLLITFGSAGMIANVVGGVMLTYMRAFRVGDRVRIADTLGDVIEQSLLVTRVRTSKQVDVTIPNSLVLGSHIVNWSAMSRSEGVQLHTGITIGYDVPWRRVHELLLGAARNVRGVLAEPAPFVLQTALNDHHVSYELNVWTREPGLMLSIYSKLHENIQDRFGEAGIEIMSPVYEARRDGNASTIPAEYRGMDGGEVLLPPGAAGDSGRA